MAIRGDNMHAWMIFIRQLPIDLYFPRYLMVVVTIALILSLFIFSFVKLKVVKSHRAKQ